MLSILNKIAPTEHNSCEDNYYAEENDEVIIGIVADGCSTGKNSEFASKLLCNAFKKFVLTYDGITDIPIDSDYFIFKVFITVKEVKELLNLEVNELLSTAIFFKYYKNQKSLIIRVFGDAYIFTDETSIVVDQDNAPDYFAYHLEDVQGLVNYIRKYNSDKIFTDYFSICSDGIASFVLPQNKDSIIDPKTLLLSPNNSSNHLVRKYNILKKQGWINKDDVTIISYNS